MTESAPPTAIKVTLYVTHRGRLLLFLTPINPKTLPQVPGGTVEPGEDFAAAARRELEEETGLVEMGPMRALGIGWYHFKYRGFDELHERHYFHVPLADDAIVAERWTHTEMNSSLGFKPYEIALYWADLETAARELGYGFGEKLPELRAVLSSSEA